jgi:hypothetical protein
MRWCQLLINSSALSMNQHFRPIRNIHWQLASHLPFPILKRFFKSTLVCFRSRANHSTATAVA